MKLTSKFIKKLIKEEMGGGTINKIAQLVASSEELGSIVTKQDILALTRSAGMDDAAVLGAIKPLHFMDDSGDPDKYDFSDVEPSKPLSPHLAPWEKPEYAHEEDEMRDYMMYGTGGYRAESLNLTTDALKRIIKEEIVAIVSERKKNG